jgi:hypothetical protein
LPSLAIYFPFRVPDNLIAFGIDDVQMVHVWLVEEVVVDGRDLGF